MVVEGNLHLGPKIKYLNDWITETYLGTFKVTINIRASVYPDLIWIAWLIFFKKVQEILNFRLQKLQVKYLTLLTYFNHFVGAVFFQDSGQLKEWTDQTVPKIAESVHPSQELFLKTFKFIRFIFLML